MDTYKRIHDKFILFSGSGENDVREEIVKKTFECGTHLKLSDALEEVNN